jgi:alpha-L-arabinofuranosidase
MANITVNARRPVGTINRNLFGHFSEHLGRCVYGGLYVGEGSPIPNVDGVRTDVAQALKHIKVPVLRWPGGCFADEYHWRDGIGPKDQRKRMVNTNWGYVVEDNSFGTHEFINLCRQIGCEPYVNGNVGSGTVREMAEWVEYLNSDGLSSVVEERVNNGRKEPFGVKYFCVGNESWGCGGNMRPEYYADEYRRYQTYCRDYGSGKLFRIACGPSDADYRWTEVLMQNAARFMDALTMHYYTVVGPDWQHKGSATRFTVEDYYKTLRKALGIEPIIKGHLQIMDRYDPAHKVALIVDEWGTWFDVEPGTNPGFLFQQNTMRDALVAALTLNVFMRHCDRVAMANIAQTVNVLQAVVLTEGDKMALTPTYHVFDLYKAHQDAQAVDCFVESGEAAEGIGMLHASASVKDGALTLTVANASADQPLTAEIALDGFAVQTASGRILAGAMDDYNDFEHTRLAPKPFTGVKAVGGRLVIDLPACSVAEITCK